MVAVNAATTWSGDGQAGEGLVCFAETEREKLRSCGGKI